MSIFTNVIIIVRDADPKATCHKTAIGPFMDFDDAKRFAKHAKLGEGDKYVTYEFMALLPTYRWMGEHTRWPAA